MQHAAAFQLERSPHHLEIDVLNVADQIYLDFELSLGALTYRGRFEAQPGSDRLFVFLRSAVSEPLLRPNSTATAMGAHVLGISDPVFLQSSAIKTGSFLGTTKQDAVIDMIRISERIAASLQLDRSRIIYWGTSGSGLGAAMAAVKSGATAVLVNALVDGHNMDRSELADLAAKTFGVETAPEIAAKYPLRSSVAKALTTARTLGHRCKLLLVQNKLDRGFYKRQYIPFCRQLGIPPDGGADSSGMFRSVLYSDTAGHGPEPDYVRAQLMTKEIPRFVNPLSSAFFSNHIYDFHLSDPGTHAFRVPPGTSYIRLLSGEGSCPGDARTLGAAISKITIAGCEVSLSDPSLISGFHLTEQHNGRTFRWTNGNAIVPICNSPQEQEVEIEAWQFSESK